MKHIRKFISLLEAAATATAPNKTKEKVKFPVKPKKPTIKQPVETSPRKAVTEMDVVNRFIEETNKMGESVEKYIK